MRNAMLDLIRASNDPTKLALDMAHAIRYHLDDVVDDDPGDHDATTLPVVACARRNTDALVEALMRLTRRDA